MRKKDSIYKPLGKAHFIGWVMLTVVNTMIVINDNRKSRMMLFIAVLVLQHLTLLLFMIDYEKLHKNQWKRKEERIRKELGTVSN